MTESQPRNRRFGYARVSTVGQTLDSQLEQLRAAGCSSRNIYREKVTRARADAGRIPYRDSGVERGAKNDKQAVICISRSQRQHQQHHGEYADGQENKGVPRPPGIGKKTIM